MTSAMPVQSALVERPGAKTSVPSTLSGHAADIWRSAFDSAYSDTCKERKDREACAAKIAWSAVKNKYRKSKDGNWVEKVDMADADSLQDAEGDSGLPLAIEPDRPIIPTPQNLTRGEAEVWNRVYLEAMQGECGGQENPQACSAREAWNAVKAFGEQAEQDDAIVEVEAEVEAEEDEESDVPSGDEEEEAAAEEEADEESADDDEAVEDGSVEDEEEEEDDEDEEDDERKGKKKPPYQRKSLIERREFSDRRRKKLAREGKALPDGSFPITNCEDVENAVRAFGRHKGSDVRVKRHIMKRARALGCIENVPDEWRQGAEKKSLAVEEVSMTPSEYTERQMKALIAAGRALPGGRVPIVHRADVAAAVGAYIAANAADAQVVAHIITRAGSLGALEELPDTWLNMGTVPLIERVDEKWISATVERVLTTMDDLAWLERIGEETKITRPGHIESMRWRSLPPIERTARAEYLRRFVKRMYAQAVDDMRVAGWDAKPLHRGSHEMEFKRFIDHEEGPLLQRTILIRKVGSKVWRPREISRGASMSSAVLTAADEIRP